MEWRSGSTFEHRDISKHGRCRIQDIENQTGQTKAWADPRQLRIYLIRDARQGEQARKPFFQLLMHFTIKVT